MAEPPVCAGCGGRHWFLDPCGTREPPNPLVIPVADMVAGATRDEIEKALAYYRAHKARERDRQRKKRAAPDHKG